MFHTVQQVHMLRSYVYIGNTFVHRRRKVDDSSCKNTSLDMKPSSYWSIIQYIEGMHQWMDRWMDEHDVN